MLRTIRTELNQAAKTIGGSHVTMLAPVYLCACDLHADTLNDAGEMLLQTLEQDSIFDPLQDAFVLLSITGEEHVSENEVRRIGFTDRFGQYRHSLSGWLRYLSADMHITTGVILIRAEHFSMIEQNPEWWNIQLQCMESHKNAFVFVIASAPRSLSALYDTVSPRCHCSTIETLSVSPESYAEIFSAAIKPYQLTLTPDAKACIVKTVSECSEPVSIMQIVQWARSTAWRYLTGGGADGKQAGVLSAESVSADAFREKNSLSAVSKEKQRIGY